MSIEMVDAMDRDMTVINEDGTVDYVETEEAPAAEPVAETEYQEVKAEELPAQNEGQQQSSDGLQW